MNARIAASILALGAVVAALSCSGGPTISVAPREPEKVTFSEIGNHVLPDKRLVEITATIIVSDIPDKTKKVQVWAPAPFGSAVQTVMEPIIESPAIYRPIIRLDTVYDSPSIFLLVDAPLERGAVGTVVPLPKEVRLSYTAQVERLRTTNLALTALEDPADLKLPVSLSEEELKAALAAVPAAVDNTPIARARAIYDYVIDTLQPDNTTGAKPLKDILETRRGSALDYASLTVALLRTAGIPARIESGLYLPEEKSPDGGTPVEIGAWVSFRCPGMGWGNMASCDPYRADRVPELKDYLFGRVDANRVQMGVGPEPGLLPPPEVGAPLVLIETIAEADGKPITVKTTYTFRDVCPK